MRRFAAGMLLCAAAAWGQALPIDCGRSMLLDFSPAINRYNLSFSGQQDEAVLFRLIPVTGDFGFTLALPVIADAFGNTSRPRPNNPVLPGATPVDIANQGYEFDLPADGVYTLRLQTVNTNLSGSIRVAMTRTNRPCRANTTLICGRSTAGSIPGTGVTDTYQYQVTAGDTISFRLLRVPEAGAIDTNTGFFLAVYGPDGHAINTVNGRVPFALFGTRSDVTVTVSGTLTVLVWEATGVRGGLYYLSGTRLNGGCGGPGLTCNSAVDGQITTPLSFSSYTLPAVQGDVYLLRAGRADTFGTFTVAAEIYDATGKRVGLVGPVSPSGHAAATSVFTAPASGNYSVLVSGPADGSGGVFTLTSTRLNKPCSDQTIDCSAIVDGAIAGLLRNRVYALPAKANDTFLVRLLQPDTNSLFRPRIDIYDAAGNQLQFGNTSNLTRFNFTAPADGTYTLIAGDSFDSAQSGTYSFSVQRLNRPCNPTTLTCGAPVDGGFSRMLASGLYTYDAAPGESFSVRMLGGANGLQPSIEVYDPSGALTGQNFTAGFTGVDVPAPAGGTYTVLALDGSKSPVAGTYTLDLLRTKNACSVPVPQGQTVSGVVSAAAPFLSYRIAAGAGDTLALRSASSTNGFSAQMEIYDPEGQRLDSGVFGLTRKIAAAGTYTVLVGAAAAHTAGRFAFAWQLLNKPAATAPAACGGSTTGALALASQFRYYTLSADAGDTLRVIFTRTSDNFNPQIEIFDPAGARIAANSDVLQKVAVGGDYLAIVSPSSTAAETGNYTIAFQRPNNPCLPAALTCGQTALRQVSTPGQLDTIAFNGTAGDLHTIRLVSRSGSYSPFVELFNPAGTRISTSSTGQIRSVLTADGMYSLLIRDRGGVNLGSYRVSLQDDTVTCPVDDKESPSITLVRPTGGEVVAGGATFRVQWISDDNVGVASHDVALSTDGGKTFGTTIAGGLSGAAQSFDWSVPPDIAPSRTAVVRITATDDAGNRSSTVSDLLTLIGAGFTPNSTATYTYDALNQLVRAALGDGRTVTFTWDAAGNLIQVAVSGQ